MKSTGQKNYYEILGVARDAKPEDIRKAYLKLAHKHHPDKTGGDKQSETFLKEINAAYDTLKNPEKRKQYDAELNGFGFGQDFGSGRGYTGGFRGAGAEGFDFSRFSGGGGGGFEDIFSSFFSGAGAGAGAGTGARREPSAMPGADLETPITITLEEAYRGVKKTARIRRQETCGQCSGSGAAPGSQPMQCHVCHGSGQTVQSTGAFSVRSTCPHCHGAGTVVATPCPRCSGTGQTLGERTISVDIPAGVEHGARLRLAGQGESGQRGAAPGDLFIHVLVQPHPMFSRKGNDLICEVPITVSQAALGAQVRVPTLTGMADLSIPAGTQSGAQFRMRGLGMPGMRGSTRGDQLVKVQVEVPVRLSKRQRELFQELGEHSSDEHHPKRRGFLDWLKRNRS